MKDEGSSFESCYDMANNILIFSSDREILYDLERKKKTVLDIFDFTDRYANSGYWSYFEIGEVTDQYIEVIYTNVHRNDENGDPIPTGVNRSVKIKR